MIKNAKKAKKLVRFSQYDDFFVFLTSAFEKRKQVNPKYSIRAFANYLDVDHSLLSKILKGERQLSAESCHKILRKLGADEEFITKFTSKKGTPKKRFEMVDEEAFEFLSNWRYFAILELMTLKDFVLTPKEVANRLGMTVKQAKQHIDRLLKYEFITFENGEYSVLKQYSSSYPVHTSTEARREFQKSILLKSIESLEKHDLSIRDHSSLTLAIKKSQMPHFKLVLKDVRRQLCEIFQEGGDFDDVYQLSISLFPLTEQTP